MVMERLDAARKLPENQNPAKQSAIKEAEKLLILADVKDPGVKVETSHLLTPDEAKTAIQELLPSFKQLVRIEREALSAFFGKDIAVPKPPQELFQTLEEMLELGITGFKPHFLPRVSLTEKSRIPGWKVKPEPWFWQKIKDGSVSADAATLQKGWYLVDGRKKPNYDNGQQRYENDYAEPIMQELRETGKIHKYSFVPDISRFGASPDEIEKIILPEFAKLIGTRGEINNRSFMQFNVWGNMFHPEWGETNTSEWFDDKLGGGDRRLRGGRFDFGGLARVNSLWSGVRDDDIAFSPVIKFSSRAR